MDMEQHVYTVRFSVDYPDRPLDRMTTFFRLFLAIPILVVLGSVSGGIWQWTSQGHTTAVAAGAGGLLAFAPLLMIVFRQKYPRWWFDWNRELLRFSNRVGVYLALMDDRYPATDEQQSVHSGLPLPGCPARAEPLAAPGEMVPGDPPLHRLALPQHRCGHSRNCGLVRHPVYRAVPEGAVCLRRGRHALAQPRDRVRCGAGDRPLPPVPSGPVSRTRAHRPTPPRAHHNAASYRQNRHSILPAIVRSAGWSDTCS